MINLSTNNKLIFLEFLKGNLKLIAFENFISQTNELEKELETELYIDLLTFDYKDKNSSNRLQDFILENVVSESEFETWKLTELLQDFINHPSKAKDLLDEFYYLYCGTYNRKGELTNGYRFLGHLGLNYFYWIDENYLKITHGDKWQVKYEQTIKNIEFYQKQLMPIAERILHSIRENKIKILSKGEYQIEEQLKKEFEGDTIFQLIHPH